MLGISDIDVYTGDEIKELLERKKGDRGDFDLNEWLSFFYLYYYRKYHYLC